MISMRRIVRTVATAASPRSTVGSDARAMGVSRKEFEVIFALCTVLSIALVLSIVFRHAGWPSNDNSGPYNFNIALPMIETQAYAAHFRQLDFFPVWQSSDAFGLGTPVLLYFQKLFYVTSGLVYLVIGHIKVATLLALGLFMAVGAYGMRAALSVVTRRRVLLTVGSLALIFANYSFDDWLIRGDFGEFSAMMLLPWLIWWSLELINKRRASYWIAPIAVLLVLAHVAIAGLAAVMVVIASIAFVCVATRREMIQAARRVAISAAAAAAVLSPMLIAVLKFNRSFDPPARLSIGIPQFLDPSVYFLGGTIPRFFRNYPDPDFQIGVGIWLLVAIGLVGIVGMHAAGQARLIRRNLPTAAVVFLIASVAVYMFLQLPVSRVVYEHVRTLQEVQFPWRMLALITPLGIVAVITFAEAGLAMVSAGAVLPSVLGVAWLLSFVVASPIFSTYRWGYVPAGEMTAPRYLRYGQYPLLVGVAGEYLPEVKGQVTGETKGMYIQLYKAHLEAQALSPGAACTVGEPQKTTFDTLQLSFTVACDRPTELALPVTTNAYTTVSVRSHGHSRPVPLVSVPTDPRIVVRVTSVAPEVLSVSLPTLGRVLF
jgi:hypothetical protein